MCEVEGLPNPRVFEREMRHEEEWISPMPKS
jgi:hypothetical protein